MSSSVSPKKGIEMKLYIYEHCPFCVRARMIFGLRHMLLETVVLLNDDEMTPIGLIGVKQVPILEKPDGSHMGESLDIVRFVDELSGSTRLYETIRPEINEWFERVGKYYNRLTMPRQAKLSLSEFATPSAVAYFVNKKQQKQGNFEQNLANTHQYLSTIHFDLAQLSQLMPDGACYVNGKNLSMEDILIFPVLRNLSIVKGLVLPENIRAYLLHMAQQSQVDLYFERAL